MKKILFLTIISLIVVANSVNAICYTSEISRSAVSIGEGKVTYGGSLWLFEENVTFWAHTEEYQSGFGSIYPYTYPYDYPYATIKVENLDEPDFYINLESDLTCYPNNYTIYRQFMDNNGINRCEIKIEGAHGPYQIQDCWGLQYELIAFATKDTRDAAEAYLVW